MYREALQAVRDDIPKIPKASISKPQADTLLAHVDDLAERGLDAKEYTAVVRQIIAILAPAPPTQKKLSRQLAEADWQRVSQATRRVRHIDTVIDMYPHLEALDTAADAVRTALLQKSLSEEQRTRLSALRECRRKGVHIVSERIRRALQHVRSKWRNGMVYSSRSCKERVFSGRRETTWPRRADLLDVAIDRRKTAA